MNKQTNKQTKQKTNKQTNKWAQSPVSKLCLNDGKFVAGGSEFLLRRL